LFENRIRYIISTLSDFQTDKKSIFITSSFQTQSLVLLKIISDYDKKIPIYFINTGYHFPETILYKNQLTSFFDLNVIDLYSDIPLTHQINANGRLLYTSDTDRCCEINKTGPLKNIINKYDVWVTGIRRDQSKYRKISKNIEKLQNGKTKYNPFLDWTQNDIQDFNGFYNLPKHPLDSTGLMSIGCQPCTRLLIEQNRDDGRWFGQTKTECGLHLYFKEQS